MSESVSWILFDELDSGRGEFNEYYNRLESVVPTPDTEIVDLSLSDRKPWDAEEIERLMRRNEWKKAFVRSMQKASPRNIEKGSIIKEPAESEIDRTISSLIVQLKSSLWESGGSLAIRELLDTRFCLGKGHYMCHPEVRYIIEGGEIICRIPESVSISCPLQYEHLEDVIESSSTPDDMAKDIACEFDNSTWAVDFVMDTHGDWYCLEMNLNGVRWSEDRERWVNMCGYGDKVHLSPEVIHRPVLDEIRNQRDS